MTSNTTAGSINWTSSFKQCYIFCEWKCLFCKEQFWLRLHIQHEFNMNAIFEMWCIPLVSKLYFMWRRKWLLVLLCDDHVWSYLIWLPWIMYIWISDIQFSAKNQYYADNLSQMWQSSCKIAYFTLGEMPLPDGAGAPTPKPRPRPRLAALPEKSSIEPPTTPIRTAITNERSAVRCSPRKKVRTKSWN